MSTEELNLENLRKAANSSENSINAIRQYWRLEEIQPTLMAGVIKNFEFTYELCWKAMKRWIETNVSSDMVTGVPRIQLFRVAAENKLIDDVEIWMEFHKARNQSSHLYGEEVAQNIFAKIEEFIPYLNRFLETLLETLEERND
jgi:nucleotidyltransferase substrate binding protein (TIGR01987 family)